jgi:hypothetical protein
MGQVSCVVKSWPSADRSMFVMQGTGSSRAISLSAGRRIKQSDPKI